MHFSAVMENQFPQVDCMMHAACEQMNDGKWLRYLSGGQEPFLYALPQLPAQEMGALFGWRRSFIR